MPQAGDIYAPSDIPRRVGVTLGTADVSATSGTTEKTLDAVTISAVAGKTYSVRYTFHYTAATVTSGGTTNMTNDGYLVRIRQGGLAGVQLTYAAADIVMAAGNVHTRYVEVDWVASVTGTQTFTTTIQRSTGSGTCIVKGAVSQPRKLEARFEE
jgi:hypothetical protein